MPNLPRRIEALEGKRPPAGDPPNGWQRMVVDRQDEDSPETLARCAALHAAGYGVIMRVMVDPAQPAGLLQ